MKEKLFCWNCGKRGVMGINPFDWFCSEECRKEYVKKFFLRTGVK